MVSITEIDIEPDREAVNPSFRLNVTIEHSESEFPVFESARLYAGNKRIALLDFSSKDIDQELKAGSSADEPETATFRLELIGRLSDSALSHLEDIRERSPSGNLQLSVELKGRRIQSNISISSLHQSNESLNYGSGEGNVVVFNYDSTIRPDNNDMWLLTARGMATILYNRGLELEESIKIPGTDWLNHFLSVFTDKEVITITYDIDGELPEELEEAWEHLDNAEEKFYSHDDKGAVAECREAYQAVKKRDEEFKELLGEEKWGDVVRSANAVKDIGLHVVEREEQLRRTDVEMVINTMRNFVAYAAKNHE